MNSGENENFLEIWEQCRQALREYVHRKLAPKLHAAGDASDVVQSAFASLWKKIESGDAPTGDDEALNKYLVTIARRKLAKMWRRIYAKKRGEGKELNSLEATGDEPGNQLRKSMQEELQKQLEIDIETVLSRFDTEAQTIAAMKLTGMKNREIQEALNCTNRRVERNGSLLRKAFEEYLHPPQ